MVLGVSLWSKQICSNTRQPVTRFHSHTCVRKDKTSNNAPFDRVLHGELRNEGRVKDFQRTVINGRQTRLYDRKYRCAKRFYLDTIEPESAEGPSFGIFVSVLCIVRCTHYQGGTTWIMT
jgi:hypothetical protein